MRSIGLDVHRDFCEVAVAEGGEIASTGRIAATPAALELFAGSLAPADQVALEVTGGAWEIARIIEPHVARVIVVSPADTAIRQARAKTDRLDARALARLLAAGSLDDVWVPDEQTWVMRRRLSRRAQLVRERTRSKNEIHAVIIRRLIGRPPVSDVFGVKGRRWLAELELPVEERETLESCLRQIAFLDSEIAAVDRLIARDALSCPQIRRLMTVPGVNVIVAATFLAAIATSSASALRASSSATSVWTPGSASRGRARRSTATSPSKGRPGSLCARRGVLERGPPARSAARVLRPRSHPPRPPGRRRRGRAQARLLVLVSAHPRRGLRRRPAVADAPEVAPARARRGRPTPPRSDRHLGHQRDDAPGRARARRASRDRLRAHRPRLAGRGAAESGRERDTGARITKALEGPSRAADHKPLTSALRYVSHSRPPTMIAQEAPPHNPT
jgi:hypothetical protein